MSDPPLPLHLPFPWTLLRPLHHAVTHSRRLATLGYGRRRRGERFVLFLGGFLASLALPLKSGLCRLNLGVCLIERLLRDNAMPLQVSDLPLLYGASWRRNSCINCSSVSGVAPASKLVRGLALSRILGNPRYHCNAAGCSRPPRRRDGPHWARPWRRAPWRSLSNAPLEEIEHVVEHLPLSLRCSGNARTIRSRSPGPGPVTQSTCAVKRA